ncbi:DUF1934 domain-containing protein [Alkalihalobacillus trypoxylicola]|uniref:DUF1934 domain-containing protein n=1 Tax=Alkalihalobacillus trypoxylicola TaxID=519424 RepID=A0A161PJ32_9BACI|nr:DUF1934 family protein [Alkalihalobacillus trypoxylicola]KYG29271.1 hypothetical protein AZF04_07020 [Alkalihalobacillus trypoxylicola]
MDRTVKRPIKLKFQTLIHNGDHRDSYEFTTKGFLYIKGQQQYLHFEESFGHNQKVKTTMKWNGEELTLIRQGSLLMRQVFESGKTTIGRYVTSEVTWETTAETEKVLVQWPSLNRKGRIFLRYRFRMQGQDTGTHEVRLMLEEENE